MERGLTNLQDFGTLNRNGGIIFLPEELLIHISESASSQSTLASLASTCKTLHAIVTRILYERIEPLSANALRALDHTFGINRPLAALTRALIFPALIFLPSSNHTMNDINDIHPHVYLRFITDSRDRDGIAIRGAKSRHFGLDARDIEALATLFYRVARRCPNLENLRVPLSYDHSLLTEIHILGNPSLITTLSVVGAASHAVGVQDLLSNLPLPNLESLFLHRYESPREETSVNVPFAASFPRLRMLHLEWCIIRENRLLPFVRDCGAEIQTLVLRYDFRRMHRVGIHFSFDDFTPTFHCLQHLAINYHILDAVDISCFEVLNTLTLFMILTSDPELPTYAGFKLIGRHPAVETVQIYEMRPPAITILTQGDLCSMIENIIVYSPRASLVRLKRQFKAPSLTIKHPTVAVTIQYIPLEEVVIAEYQRADWSLLPLSQSQ